MQFVLIGENKRHEYQLSKNSLFMGYSIMRNRGGAYNEIIAL